MKIVAKKALRYAGRSLVPGDEFEASSKDARLLKAIGKAEEAEDRDETKTESLPDAKGKYRTRRMKAGDIFSAPIVEPDEDAAEE